VISKVPERRPPSPMTATPHDVTVVYHAENEDHFFVPNNERALKVMLTVSPEGCEGMKVGDQSPSLPWTAAYFMAEHLRGQSLEVREQIVEED
jgi:hypothetical protein